MPLLAWPCALFGMDRNVPVVQQTCACSYWPACGRPAAYLLVCSGRILRCSWGQPLLRQRSHFLQAMQACPMLPVYAC